MAYPYAPSAGPILKTLEHFRRKRVPKEIDADVLRKLGLAPKNESYVLNILRFLGIIDESGKTDADRSKVFAQHKDDAFAGAFGPIVRDAYAELFELHGDSSWSLGRTDLIHFFRQTDHSSEVVGQRQAATFAALAGLAGHGDTPKVREGKSSKATSKKQRGDKGKSQATKRNESSVVRQPTDQRDSESKIGLTVRIEVNLPADGNQETYDRIFSSIRKNLIDG